MDMGVGSSQKYSPNYYTVVTQELPCLRGIITAKYACMCVFVYVYHIGRHINRNVDG